ncbi:unnamed protein product [Amoebophrya sp. A120]|nr:unnamed protein product [Amoebophrya sp. A120]|eukprot:GSA120T00023329001.1
MSAPPKNITEEQPTLSAYAGAYRGSEALIRYQGNLESGEVRTALKDPYAERNGKVDPSQNFLTVANVAQGLGRERNLFEQEFSSKSTLMQQRRAAQNAAGEDLQGNKRFEAAAASAAATVWAGKSVQSRQSTPLLAHFHGTSIGTVATGWKQYRRASMLAGPGCTIIFDGEMDHNKRALSTVASVETLPPATELPADPDRSPSPAAPTQDGVLLATSPIAEQLQDPEHHQDQDRDVSWLRGPRHDQRSPSPRPVPEYIRSKTQSWYRKVMSQKELHQWYGGDPYAPSHHVRLEKSPNRYRDLPHSVFYTSTRSAAQMRSPRATRPGAVVARSHVPLHTNRRSQSPAALVKSTRPSQVRKHYDMTADVSLSQNTAKLARDNLPLARLVRGRDEETGDRIQQSQEEIQRIIAEAAPLLEIYKNKKAPVLSRVAPQMGKPDLSATVYFEEGREQIPEVLKGQCGEEEQEEWDRRVDAYGYVNAEVYNQWENKADAYFKDLGNSVVTLDEDQGAEEKGGPEDSMFTATQTQEEQTSAGKNFNNSTGGGFSNKVKEFTDRGPEYECLRIWKPAQEFKYPITDRAAAKTKKPINSAPFKRPTQVSPRLEGAAAPQLRTTERARARKDARSPETRLRGAVPALDSSSRPPAHDVEQQERSRAPKPAVGGTPKQVLAARRLEREIGTSGGSARANMMNKPPPKVVAPMRATVLHGRHQVGRNFAGKEFKLPYDVNRYFRTEETLEQRRERLYQYQKGDRRSTFHERSERRLSQGKQDLYRSPKTGVSHHFVPAERSHGYRASTNTRAPPPAEYYYLTQEAKHLFGIVNQPEGQQEDQLEDRAVEDDGAIDGN